MQKQLGITEEFNENNVPGFAEALEQDFFDFYVIYSFDIPRREWVGPHKPKQIKLWELTEGDSLYEYGYLGEESAEYEEWKTGKHRKYVGRLTYQQFKDFIDEQDLYPEEIETLGSITEYGWLPAISFNCEFDGRAIKSAYVTPIVVNPKTQKDLTELQEKHWQIVRKRIIELFK